MNKKEIRKRKLLDLIRDWEDGEILQLEEGSPEWVSARRAVSQRLSKEWCKNNKEKMRVSAKKKRETVTGRLNSRMSSRLRHALKSAGGKNKIPWVSLVGYTREELIRHIELNFKKGMTWKNIDKWHIDHVVPLYAWNYKGTDDIKFKQAWGLRNLRPLWKKENLEKNKKLPSMEEIRAVKFFKKELLDGKPKKE